MQTKPRIVFVHGIWADGSCFGKVIPALQAEGYEVMAARHSLDTLKGDVATVTRTLGRVSAPAILVGHSYGGTVITAEGTDDRVAGLALHRGARPRRGRDVAEPAEPIPRHRCLPHIEIADGRVWMLPKGVETFAGDLRRLSDPPARTVNRRCRHCWVEPTPSWPPTTVPSNRSCNASWRSVWATIRSTAATFPCCPTPAA